MYINYVDIHTHLNKMHDHLQILNVFAQKLQQPFPQVYFSTGIHPWHLNEIDGDACLGAIEMACNLENMLAVGECGLDRSIAVNLDIQEYFFIEQIKIAERFAKPLIIHNVRSSSDLIRIKKIMKSKIPWILHGYSGNIQTTRELVRNGFFFSIGDNFFRNQASFEVLKLIPLHSLFLESDMRDRPINQLYCQVSEALIIKEEELTSIIFTNFQTVFGKFLLKD